MVLLRTFILLGWFLLGAAAFATVPAGAKKNQRTKKTTEQPSEAVPILAAAAPMVASVSGYRREFESGFGQLVLLAPSVLYCAQMRFWLGTALPIYVGGDLQFSLFTSGYLLTTMPGAWYNFTLRSVPLATLSLGLLAGPSFAHQVNGIPDTAFGAFGEASISFEIDDLSTVRGQFRPGIVGGKVAFAMAMLIGFRFR